MPYFNVEDVDISPDEFLRECSQKELNKTFEMLQENYGFDPDVEEKESVRSESHRKFLYHLQCLRQNWNALTKEDASIIAILAGKYGAL